MKHNKHNRTPISALLLAAGALLIAACSSGLGNNTGQDPTPAAASRATGLGLDLGFALAEQVDDDYAVVGALIPGVTPEEDRRISFVAFTTATDNDDADGMGVGTELTRDSTGPTDGNASSDVFVMAIEDELMDPEGTGAQPAAFSRALINTFRHSRCVHCHAMGSTPDVGEPFVFPGNTTHPGGGQPLLTDSCTTCHMAPNVAPNVEWRSPRENNGQPFDFRGETVAELAARAQSVPFDEHLLNDTRVTWALESGIVPFDGSLAGSSSVWSGVADIDVGPVPISFDTFRAQLLAWEAAGFPVTAASSIRDVTLVSRSRSGNQTANGASSAPAVTWVPNPAYDPANPTAQPAGQIVLAYVSDADDLVVGGNATQDVYRTALDVFVDRDPATGAALAGGLDVVSSGTSHVQVSQSTGSAAGNDVSSAPALDSEGDLVAFVSNASNLVAGFTDANAGGTDVFLRDITGGTTTLVSVTTPGGTTGGDGSSEEPAMSPTGEVVAFTTAATDLVAADSNGVRDVLFTQRVAGTLDPLQAASRTTGGTLASGGDSSSPGVAVTSAGRIAVVYESSATNLATIAAGTNVFVHEEGTTTLLSQVQSGGSSTPGNGPSSAPRISPTGDCVVYASDATNLDVVQPSDENAATDALLVDLAGLRTQSEVRGRRISLDSAGLDADSASTEPRIATFRASDGSFATSSFAFFRTDAEDLGVTQQDLVTVFLNDAAVAASTDFSADVQAGAAPLAVQFTDTSTGGPTAWSWDFGDGNTSTLQNPAHTYTVIGTYDVALTVTREGVDDTETKTSFVEALEPLSITSFSADNVTGPTPLQSTFTAVLQGSQDGIAYQWDFGDTNMSTDAMPMNTYATVGTFNVTLTVTGTAGTDTLTQTGYITTTMPSGATFGFTQNGLRTTFTDMSTGSPTSWLWDFGDGNTSTSQNPTHDYDSNGVRTVMLTVNGPGGMSSTSTMVTVDAEEFASVANLLSTNGCNSCHSGGSPSGGLLFNGASNMAIYNSLYDQLAQGAQCDNGVRRRVVPFSAAASLIVDTVDPAITACNAGNGMGTFDAGELVILRRWINEGATFD